MNGERRLRLLLAGMDPMLNDGEFVFCSLSEEQSAALGSRPVATFHESEGLSVVVSKEAADQAGLDYAFSARMITLAVHASLSAVGFLAAIAGRLAAAGISVNPVAATFHDYLFVPTDQAEEAMLILHGMMKDSA